MRGDLTEIHYSLCEANKVLVIGVHVSQLEVNQHQNLLLGLLLLLTNVRSDDAFGGVAQIRVPGHLEVNKQSVMDLGPVNRTIKLTLSVQTRTTDDNSSTTKSIHFKIGSFNCAICFLTIASKAMSGVNNPTRIP